MKKYKISKVRRSIRSFADHGSDLNSSDFNTFEDRIGKFCHFCESDEVFKTIHEQLKAVAAEGFDAWWQKRLATVGGMAGSGQLVFPMDDRLRVSFMYELIFRIKEERISFQTIAHNFIATSSTRYDDYIYSLHETVTAPMIRDIGYMLDEMEEDLDQDEDEMVFESSIQIIQHAENVIQQNARGSNISQNASLEVNNELKSLFKDLRSNPSITKEDQETIEAAEEEATKPNPRKIVVETLLNGLSFCSSVAGTIAGILTIIGG